MTTPVFVISLARATERRANMIRRLDDSKMHYEIVDAVDGATLDLSQYADRLDNETMIKNYGYGTELTKGEIGCYLSHYNLWERMVAESIPHAIILEDDAQWDKDLPQVIEELVNSEWQFDIALLCASVHRNTYRIIQAISNNRNILQYKRHVVYTSGYYITLAAAKKLLLHCHVMKMPIDGAWDNYRKWNGRFYVVYPNPVKITGDTSLIGSLNRNKRVNRKLKTRTHFIKWLDFMLNRPVKK